MKKISRLRLAPDALRVESFATGADGAEGGTVRGHAITQSIGIFCECVTQANLDCTYGPTCAVPPHVCIRTIDP